MSGKPSYPLYQAHRRQGMALLLTLMVLVILATVMVQFQVDAALFMRSSNYQLEKQQCRYAAESGLVIASNILQEKIRSGEVMTGDALTNPLAGENPALDLSGLAELLGNDPNLMADPNTMADPNGTPVLLELVSSDSVVVLFEKELDVGDAEVTIEIHDEHAKWPMLWMMPQNSPFSKNTNESDKLFKDLTGFIAADPDDSSRLLKLTKDLGRSIKLPPAEFTVNKSRSTRRRGRAVRRRRVRGYTKRLEEARQKREGMALFAQSFYTTINEQSEYATLKQPMTEREVSLVDYFGFWGHNRININTAPVEIIQAAFAPLGLTESQAQAIVSYRQQQKFTQLSDIRKVEGIERPLAQSIMPLCLTRSETFSVKITARIGRTSYRVTGAVHYNRGRVQPLAMVND